MTTDTTAAREIERYTALEASIQAAIRERQAAASAPDQRADLGETILSGIASEDGAISLAKLAKLPEAQRLSQIRSEIEALELARASARANREAAHKAHLREQAEALREQAHAKREEAARIGEQAAALLDQLRAVEGAEYIPKASVQQFGGLVGGVYSDPEPLVAWPKSGRLLAEAAELEQRAATLDRQAETFVLGTDAPDNVPSSPASDDNVPSEPFQYRDGPPLFSSN